MKRTLALIAMFTSILVMPTTSASAAPSCAAGGPCKLGSIGPGGGRVFYDAGSLQWWGRYLEARPISGGRGLSWSNVVGSSVYTSTSSAAATVLRQRVDGKTIGMGRVNTEAIVSQAGHVTSAARYVASLKLGGKNDWFMPSKDELNALYNFRAVTGLPTMTPGPYWSSSENSNDHAWYQLFWDGTQFTDENGLGEGPTSKDTTRSSVHSGSGFPSVKYRVVPIRAFPRGTGVRPPTSNPVLTGRTCLGSGPCAIGDYGPAGGVVFYDAGSSQPWGRYLEAAPAEYDGVGLPWKILSIENDRLVPLYRDKKKLPARIQRVLSKAIGMGQANTKLIVATYGDGAYAAKYVDDIIINGYTDWFLPSADEFNALYNTLQLANTPIDKMAYAFYWTSSEYNYENVWTQSSRKGQQFDREKWLVPEVTSTPLRARPIRAFG